MYNRRIHKSVVPKKIHLLRYAPSFHPSFLLFLLQSRLMVVSREAKAETASAPTALDSLHVSIYKNKCQETEESRNSEN